MHLTSDHVHPPRLLHSGSQALQKRRLIEKPLEHSLPALERVGRHQKPVYAVLDQLGDPAQVRSQDRNAGGKIGLPVSPATAA